MVVVAKGRNLVATDTSGFENREVLVDAIDVAFNFDIDLIHVLSPLALRNRMEGAARHAGAALDALRLIDDIGLFAWNARNTRDRAVTSAFGALLAEIRIDPVLHKLLANVSRALLVNDVSVIFFWELRHRGKNRVSGGLA